MCILFFIFFLFPLKGILWYWGPLLSFTLTVCLELRGGFSPPFFFYWRVNHSLSRKLQGWYRIRLCFVALLANVVVTIFYKQSFKLLKDIKNAFCKFHLFCVWVCRIKTHYLLAMIDLKSFPCCFKRYFLWKCL